MGLKLSIRHINEYIFTNNFNMPILKKKRVFWYKNIYTYIILYQRFTGSTQKNICKKVFML